MIREVTRIRACGWPAANPTIRRRPPPGSRVEHLVQPVEDHQGSPAGLQDRLNLGSAERIALDLGQIAEKLHERLGLALGAHPRISPQLH